MSPATMPWPVAPIVTAASPVVTPGAQLEVRRVDLGAQLTDREDQLESGANGALGIVLVRGRRAEGRHDGIADELLDDAAVALDDLAGHLEVSRQQLADVLGIAGLGQGREADEVGEQDRDEPPLRHADGRVVRRRSVDVGVAVGSASAAPHSPQKRSPAAAAGAAGRRSMQAGATVGAELSAGVVRRSTVRAGHRCSGSGRGLWRAMYPIRESDTLRRCRSCPKSRPSHVTSSAWWPVRRSATRPSLGPHDPASPAAGALRRRDRRRHDPAAWTDERRPSSSTSTTDG